MMILYYKSVDSSVNFLLPEALPDGVYVTLNEGSFSLLMAHNSNQDIHRGVKNATIAAKNSIFDGISYIGGIEEQFEILLITNLEEYLQFLVRNSAKIKDDVIMGMENSINNANLSETFQEIEKDFNSLKPLFDEIERVLKDIEDLGAKINGDSNALKNLGKNIPCVTTTCSKIKDFIPTLPTLYDGGKTVGNGTMTELNNVANLGKEVIKNRIGELGNLTGSVNLTKNLVNNIGRAGDTISNETEVLARETLKEVKVSTNLTTNLAENVIGNIETSGKALNSLSSILANLTSAIGKEALGAGKSLENLTNKITGNTTGLGIIFEGKKELNNLTENIAVNVIGSVEKSEKSLGKLTSAIEGNVLNQGKSLINIEGSVIQGIGKSEKAIANLIPFVGTKANTERNSLIVDIPPRITHNMENSEKALSNLIPSTSGKVMDDLVGNINGSGVNIGKGIGNVGTSIKNNLFGGFGNKISHTGNRDTTTSSSISRIVNIPSVVEKIGINTAGDPTKKNVNAASGVHHEINNIISGTNHEIGSFASGIGSKINSVAGGVESKVGDVSNKLFHGGGSVFGRFLKRSLSANLDFSNLKNEFEPIYETVDEIEHFITHDLKNFKNISIIIRPALKPVSLAVEETITVLENALRIAAKPLKIFYDVIKSKISYVKEVMKNAANLLDIAQAVIDEIEFYRYHISILMASCLLLMHMILIVTISIRMICDNTSSKHILQGVLALLHLISLIMVVITVAYFIIGVVSQKVICDTFEEPEENNIMKIMNKLDPSRYGLLVHTNVQEIIQNCHSNKSFYKVAAIKTVIDLEASIDEYFNIKPIEEKFEKLMSVQLNLLKFFDMDILQRVEDDLNLSAFDKIMDSPLFSEIETVENELKHVPGIGIVIKTIIKKIDTFREKLELIRAPIKMVNETVPSFVTRLKGSISDVPKKLMNMEKEAIESFKRIVKTLKEDISTSITAYVKDRVIHSIIHKIGKCGPISSAFNSSMDQACRRVIKPTNGHWFSFSCCVLISIFIIVTTSKIDKNLGILQFDRHENLHETDIVMTEKKEHIEKTEDTIQIENAL
ncbi:hypothetical protein HHI36_014459 [Cryptolaemus montrouzieri]|uniref:Uncharacterized protein n=1 Tax=Cryptolaemus montrouzieri TaxID=559131 RepID=A0ABD2N2U0_9CUCU